MVVDEEFSYVHHLEEIFHQGKFDSQLSSDVWVIN